MVFLCIVDVIPFTIFFFMWVILFQFCYIALGTNPDPEDEYANMGQFMKNFITTYRNSIGDLSLPNYDSLIEEEDTKFQQNFSTTIAWLIWLLNQFFNLIIMLNFLLAKIS